MKEWTKEDWNRLVPEANGRSIQLITEGNPDPSDQFFLGLLIQTRLDLETANKQLEGFKAQYNRDAEIITMLRGALERAQWGSRTASQSWLCCPECGAYPTNGRDRLTVGNGLHQLDCSIGEALKEKS